MFKITPNPTFTATVNLSVPGTDVPVPVKFTFRHKRLRELEAWRAQAAARERDADFMGEVIAGWDGVFDASEPPAPVPYSIESLGLLLDAYPSASVEIFIAYIRQLRDARAKN